jgi:pimeloyl-ACP methyl ester carboxylesterase
MGGHTAWMMALRHPDHVDGLVLVDAAGWMTLDPNQPRPLVFRIINNPTLQPWLDSLDLKLFLRSGLKAAFEDKTRVSDAMIDRYSDFALAPGHRQILGGVLRAITPAVGATKEKLAAIQMPTIILWGDKDLLIPVANAKKFQEAIAGSSTIIYPNVGHLPHEESPQKSVRDLLRFLSTAFPPPVSMP